MGSYVLDVYQVVVVQMPNVMNRVSEVLGTSRNTDILTYSLGRFVVDSEN